MGDVVNIGVDPLRTPETDPRPQSTAPAAVLAGAAERADEFGLLVVTDRHRRHAAPAGSGPPAAAQHRLRRRHVRMITRDNPGWIELRDTTLKPRLEALRDQLELMLPESETAAIRGEIKAYRALVAEIEPPVSEATVPRSYSR
jgi:hypothetical protein